MRIAATEGLDVMSSFRILLSIIVIVLVWLILLLSPVGYYVAGISIVALIIILFVCGCIEVQINPKD